MLKITNILLKTCSPFHTSCPPECARRAGDGGSCGHVAGFPPVAAQVPSHCLPPPRDSICTRCCEVICPLVDRNTSFWYKVWLFLSLLLRKTEGPIGPAGPRHSKNSKRELLCANNVRERGQRACCSRTQKELCSQGVQSTDRPSAGSGGRRHPDTQQRHSRL